MAKFAVALTPGLAFRALLADFQRKQPKLEGTEYVLGTNFVMRESTAINLGKA